MDREEFLTVSGVEAQALEVWLEERWLIPEHTSGGTRFSDRDLARAQFIGELLLGFGVNHEGVGLILHLVDQLHGLRGALAQARAANPGGGTG